MVGSARRTLGFASFGLPFVVVFSLSACTGGASDASPSTVARIGATNYVTQPMVTLAPPTVLGATVPPGGTSNEGQEYLVRRGDSVYGIADRYGITGDELADWNDWDGVNQPIIVGDIIRIPPFADIPSASETTVPETFLVESRICLDGSEQDTYEIQANDFVGRVADELDVTVEELNEANAVTPGYSSFYPGLEILVPCPPDDLEPTADSSATDA